jgi:TPP-dependent pyruvate/acetoin dehydrogenase alpha subunit
VRAARDPLEMQKKRILDNGLMGAAELKAFEKAIKKEVDAAAAAAAADGPPPPSERGDNLYTHPYPARGVELANSHVV